MRAGPGSTTSRVIRMWSSVSRKVAVHLPGGTLTIDWRETDDHILMTGAAELEYTGTLDPKDYKLEAQK